MTLITAVVTQGEIDVAVPDSLLQAAGTTPALDVAEPITLQQAKDHLRVVVADDDTHISTLIIAARQMAEGRLNRTLVQRRRVATFSGWDDTMTLLKPPLLSVDSIGYIDASGGEGMLDPAQYYAPPVSEDDLPRVELNPGAYPLPALVFDPQPLYYARHHRRHRRDAVRVYYTAGYPVGEVPAPIVQWMLLAIGTMYANRESEVVGATVAALPDDFMKWLLRPYQVYE